MALEWMDKYKIGDVKIDAEHQEWFRLANRFLMAGEQQALQQSGEAFSDYTHHHFVQEEILMRELQFPFIESHVKDHHSLISMLEKILDVADKDVLTQSELEEFVGYWLVKHITTFDAPFSIYIRRNGVPALL